MNQKLPLNFTNVLFSGHTHYVSISPDFVDAESLGVPYGLTVLFRNFQKQEDAQLMSEELNSVLRAGFENLKNNNTAPETIEFCSVFSYSYDKDKLFLCLNDNIFNLSNDIYLKEKVFLSTSSTETEIYGLLKFVNKIFNEYYKEFLTYA